jgi:S1-C subfamily serine protease
MTTDEGGNDRPGRPVGRRAVVAVLARAVRPAAPGTVTSRNRRIGARWAGLGVAMALVGAALPVTVPPGPTPTAMTSIGHAGLARVSVPSAGLQPLAKHASTSQQIGVVDVDIVLGSPFAGAAGTGMILTAGGEVLTNWHVVDGATSVSVTVVTTGRTYRAVVVGTSPQDDVAVVQLRGASGLRPIRVASTAAAVGDTVVGAGNAGGRGGTPSIARGKVVGLDRAIVAVDPSGGTERLSGLIETDAAIKPGDSGGPLFDRRDQVVGMNTAATASGPADSYAIPIATALAVARKITSG